MRQSAQSASAGHGADEDARISHQVTHPDPVTQNGAAGEGAGWVNRDNSHAGSG